VGWRNRYKHLRCRKCGHRAHRVHVVHRRLTDLGDPVAKRPRETHLTFSRHRCSHCGKYFNAEITDLAAPNCRYTRRVVVFALELTEQQDRLSYRRASEFLRRDCYVAVPWETIRNWATAHWRNESLGRRTK
jgi:hypothetical protein